MMKINWKVRLLSVKFWLALVLAVCLLVQAVLTPFGYLQSIGISKAQFAHDLANGIDGTKISGTTSAPASKRSSSASAGRNV